jgi:hypothetical protein
MNIAGDSVQLPHRRALRFTPEHTDGDDDLAGAM